MIDSKADDRARGPILQWLKRIMLSPYGGALVAGKRSADYVRSLGVSADRIALHYNTLDIGALRNLAKHVETLAFASRPFLVVARLIPEKNLAAALEAFAAYRNAGGKRVLAIIGEGPEEERLRALADDLGLAGLIEWRGSHSRGDVAVAMRRALALLLPSTSETYGFVVIEALAQGLPVIVSERAGVVDLPIINGVEGRVIDPANVAQICAAMQAIDSSEEEWRAWSDAASAAAGRAQTHHFVASVEGLAGLEQG